MLLFLACAGFNFTLPPVDVDIPWFSINLPSLPDIDVDASSPVEAAALIIETAAGEKHAHGTLCYHSRYSV
jgi:hypothetical protein